jgi:hypothetical protein
MGSPWVKEIMIEPYYISALDLQNGLLCARLRSHPADRGSSLRTGVSHGFLIAKALASIAIFRHPGYYYG